MGAHRDRQLQISALLTPSINTIQILGFVKRYRETLKNFLLSDLTLRSGLVQGPERWYVNVALKSVSTAD